MERVYPRLKSYCQERGYDFQVVDMRWGVRDESTDDHMTTELCMRELRACQKLSTGPNFIVSSNTRTASPLNNLSLIHFSLKLGIYVAVLVLESLYGLDMKNCLV